MSLAAAFGAALVLLAPAIALAGDNSTVEAAVRRFFSDTPVMIHIASCESQFHQFNTDGTVLHGGDKGHMIGIFQIAPMHLSEARAHGFDINTVTGNMAYAKLLYEQNGTSPWLDSSPCWASMGDVSTPSTRVSAQLASVATSASTDDTSTKIANLKQQIVQLSAIVKELVAARATS